MRGHSWRGGVGWAWRFGHPRVYRDPVGYRVTVPAHEYLELTDWRRAIAELYAAWRVASVADPEGAALAWREARDRLYREHPQSPVRTGERSGFRDRWFPYDPAWRLHAVLE